MASQKKPSTESKGRTAQAAKLAQKKPSHQDEICDMHRFLKEHPFLAKLMPENGMLLETEGEAPAPSKDYGQLLVSTDKVIIRWWKISLRNIEGTKNPGEIKNSYEEFYNDEAAQREVWRIFGQPTLDYCLNLVRGRFDWLTRLPPAVQIRILSFVDIDDIPQLSLTCKSLRSLCRDNHLWESFYARYYGQHAMENKDLIHFAERRGWRHVFFTNRLKLQMQLRREAQVDRHHPEDPSDMYQARQRRSEIQPSPPATPRQGTSGRRHSFATWREPPSISPVPDEEFSIRSPLSHLDESGDAPSPRRLPSPALSVRSNAGSTASTASAQPPAQPNPRSTPRH